METHGSSVRAPRVPPPPAAAVVLFARAAVPVVLYAACFVVFFLPVLAAGKLLAPGDGRLQNLPAFLFPPTLWTSSSFAGYPLFADPQNLFFYPLRWLFCAFRAWNAFVISAYVLAALTAYGYVRTKTGSRLAGATSGLVFSMSGFFLAHLGHVNMLHAAAWMPLVIWSLDELRARSRAGWIAAGSLAIGGAAFAGHPQMLVYELGLAVVFTGAHLVASRERRWPFLRDALALIGLGVALASVQLLPAAQLARESVRAEMPFAKFVEFSLPPTELLRLLFPYLYGFTARSPFRFEYFGSWSVTETTGFVGSLAPMLAIVALASKERRRLVVFWVAVAAFSLLFAFGDATPLARVLFHVPAYRAFRAPARHFVVMAFAVALLAGVGVAALERGGVEARRLARRAAAWVVAVFAAGAGVAVLLERSLAARASAVGGHGFSALPWRNLAIGLPLAASIVSALALLLLARCPGSFAVRAGLLAVALADLGTFGWFAEWRYDSPERSVLEVPTAFERYRERIASSGMRLHFVGQPVPPEALPPNLNRLFGVSSAAGYAPLTLRRYAEILPWNDFDVLRSENRAIDVVGARWVFVGEGLTAASSIEERDGYRWGEDLEVELTPGKRDAVEWIVPGAPTFSDVGFVAALANGARIPDGTPVATLTVRTASGEPLSFPIRAGVDVSEWAYGRSDLRRALRHAQAPVWQRSVQTDRPGESYDAFFYRGVARFERRVPVSALSIRLEPSSPATLILRKVTLRDVPTWTFHPVRLLSPGSDRFRLVGPLGRGSLFENLRARPRAWLARDVRTLAREQIVAAVRSSVLPDGERFDPAETALVERNVPYFDAGSGDPGASVELLRADAGKIKLLTWSRRPAFLVLGEATYPGWGARVDGEREPVYAVDDLLQGVPLSAGRHEVTFSFEPWTFWIGAAGSVLALAALGLLVLYGRQTKRRIGTWRTRPSALRNITRISCVPASSGANA